MSLTNIPYQAYDVVLGDYSLDAKRYTAAVDFVRNGYMDIINPEDAEIDMATRFFCKYDYSNYYERSGIYYVRPGQRASYGSFVGRGDCVMLIIPRSMAIYINRAQYNADTDT